MSNSPSHAERFRLEIRRSGESFETHGFFESVELAEHAAEDDVDGCGDCLQGPWTGLDNADHWIASARGACYRITHESQTVTSPARRPSLFTAHTQIPMTDEQVCTAVQVGLQASPATAPLHIAVDVMDHRVFLNGSVHNPSELRLVEHAVAQIPDVGEVVDLLELEQI
jgi:hypothetical protein